MSAASGTEGAPPPLTQTRQFWVLLAYAVVLGVAGALASLVFMGVIGFGDNWYVVANPRWFGGHWWWIAVTTAAGVVVGLLRLLTRLPEHTSGLIADLQEGRVEPRLVPGIVAVSAVSLIGGASLGPEKALGSIGGGAGTWVSRRRGLSAEDSQVNTLAGFGGAYGGLFSSTVIVVMLIMEVARPGGHRFTKALVGAVMASSVSFAVYFAIAGSVFLDAYPVPQYQFEDWQLLAAVPLGLFAAAVTTLLALFVKLSAVLFDRLKLPGIAKSSLGGAVFGLVGVALPLTLFTGSDQLTTVLTDGGSLGLGLLVALLIGKMLTFSVCQATGFVGGPIFPALFIGGTAGVLVHQVFPGVPLGLAFTCLLAAVPGALVAAPFSMVLLATFLTAVGALQTAPILITVLTAFLTMEGVKYLLARRQHPRAATAGQRQPPPDQPADG
jgi:chloride channel protein, CIC family